MDWLWVFLDLLWFQFGIEFGLDLDLNWRNFGLVLDSDLVLASICIGIGQGPPLL